MIFRGYYECTTCSARYITRYGASDQFPQNASYTCTKCGEILSLGYDKNKELVLKNLRTIKPDENGEIINLHPELVIDPSMKNNPFHFTTLEFMTKQMRTNEDPLGIEMKIVQASILHFNEGWDTISTDFRLLNESRFNVLEKKYGKNHEKIEKKIIKKTIEVNRHFLVGKWKNLFNTIYSFFPPLNNQTGYSLYKDYLTANKKTYIKNLYQVMDQYATVRSQLLNTLIAQKCGHEINGFASTVDWSLIEKIYGDFFEIYADLLVIPSGAKNLLERNDFNLFSSPGFTLERYMDSDKANRVENLRTESKLIGLCEFYDSGIRNGTHHKNSYIDKETQDIVLGVGKGGGIERRIPVIIYISMCNEIFARILILFNIVFKIIFS